jgi:uncharacterized protein YqgC (DUF456 family)
MELELYTVLVWAVSVVCILVGLIGTVIPIVPGTIMIFFGIALIGWWTDFVIIGVPTLIVTGLLVIASLIVDFFSSVVGAKRVGASSLALWGATLGSLIGMFFLIPGIILGPFIGAFIGEYISQSKTSQATKVGLGTWLGLLVGTVIKVGISISMVATFIFGLLV